MGIRLDISLIMMPDVGCCLPAAGRDAGYQADCRLPTEKEII